MSEELRIIGTCFYVIDHEDTQKSRHDIAIYII